MMRPPNDLPRVYLCREPTDMRKSINGLSALVEATLELNPFSTHLFVFCNRKRDKVKCLYWETNGFCLWYKRLEKQRFHWPTHLGDGVITITGQQLNWLLDGFDLKHWQPHQRLTYQSLL